MFNRKLSFILFLLLILLQLYVPAKMIFDREDVIATGTVFKFKTAPIDPNDPFRGKYITLDYDQNSIKIEKTEEWKNSQTIYVLLSKDSAGYARISSISASKPVSTPDFVEAEISYVDTRAKTLFIIYPFVRFYMEESKAYDAERLYTESLRDSSKITYGLVNVKKGEAVLTDVLIGEISISEIVKQSRR
ncbi:MAG: GDYXXLXY domain-containing protein [Chitinophagaceae bacterium]